MEDQQMNAKKLKKKPENEIAYPPHAEHLDQGVDAIQEPPLKVDDGSAADPPPTSTGTGR